MQDFHSLIFKRACLTKISEAFENLGRKAVRSRVKYCSMVCKSLQIAPSLTEFFTQQFLRANHEGDDWIGRRVADSEIFNNITIHEALIVKLTYLHCCSGGRK